MATYSQHCLTAACGSPACTKGLPEGMVVASLEFCWGNEYAWAQVRPAQFWGAMDCSCPCTPFPFPFPKMEMEMVCMEMLHVGT